MSGEPVRLRVHVTAPPEPALLRAAIEARLRGRAWTGPEREVGDAVARHLAAAPHAQEDPRWRS
jgi:hypothetical protein